jgi:hypothetical protein
MIAPVKRGGKNFVPRQNLRRKRAKSSGIQSRSR